MQDLLVSMLRRRDQWREYVGLRHAPEEAESYLLYTVQALICEELRGLLESLGTVAEPLLDLQRYAAHNLGRQGLDAFPGAEPKDLEGWLAGPARLAADQSGRLAAHRRQTCRLSHRRRGAEGTQGNTV
jgi:hypothetical protein